MGIALNDQALYTSLGQSSDSMLNQQTADAVANIVGFDEEGVQLARAGGHVLQSIKAHHQIAVQSNEALIVVRTDSGCIDSQLGPTCVQKVL